MRYQQLEDITNKVEWQLRDEGHTEISSREIGEHVMNLLMHVIKFLMFALPLFIKSLKILTNCWPSMQGILNDNKRSDL